MPINRVFFLRIILSVILLGIFAFTTSSSAIRPSTRISRDTLAVMDIYVHIEKENNHNAAEIKKQALLQAQREAFEILVGRFTDSGTFPLPSDNIIMSFVNDYEIRGEQSYPVSYTATFRIRFKPRVVEYINSKK